jgi:hypothetical protein
MSDDIRRLALRLEVAYEVPPGVHWPDVEHAVLEPFGSTIDPAFTERVDDKLWIVTAGEPSEIDKVDAQYRAWRDEHDRKAE